MSNSFDYAKEHYCPVYKRKIDADLCYDSLMCLNNHFKIESTQELKELNDIDEARKLCGECPYSEL